jgi:UPF0755 protein
VLRALLVLIAAGLLAVAGAVTWASLALTRPLPLAAPVVVEIPRGTAFGAFAERLAAEGRLDHPRLLRLWARLTGDAGAIHAGEYRLDPGTTPRELLARLVAGDVLRRQVTLLPGWRFDQVVRTLAAAPRLRTTLDGATDEEIMGRLGRPGVPAEGRFFPDTYDYVAGTTDLEILARALARLDAVLAEEWADRDFGLPLDGPDEALVLASIVEKETGRAEDRTRIAGVFVRRLERNMRLQTDPSVIYGLGPAFDGDLTRRDLRTPTPWNTYVHRGLPPTPIALASRASIRAAVRPAEGDALYFVARGDGSSEFSATLEAHNAAVRRYQLGETGDDDEEGDGR